MFFFTLQPTARVLFCAGQSNQRKRGPLPMSKGLMIAVLRTGKTRHKQKVAFLGERKSVGKGKRVSAWAEIGDGGCVIR